MRIVDQEEAPLPQPAQPDKTNEITDARPRRLLAFTKSHIIIGSSLLLSCAVIFTVVIPSVRDIIDLKNRISAERSKLDQLLISGKTMKRLISDYEKVKTELPLLDSALLVTGNELAFIETIESLARATQLTIELSFDPVGRQTPPESVIPIPAHIRVKGPFKNVLVFLNQLESQDFYTKLESLRVMARTQSRTSIGFSPPSDSDEPPPNDADVQAEMNIMTYWKKI